MPCPNCIIHNVNPCLFLGKQYNFKYFKCAIENHHRSISRCNTFEDLSKEPCFMKSVIIQNGTPLDLYFMKALELYFPNWFERINKLILLK
jgi:hypothetical protein